MISDTVCIAMGYAFRNSVASGKVTNSVIAAGDAPSHKQGMLDHEALRDELIRQLEAGEIKAVAVAAGLGIAKPRIVEMRKRERRVQQHEMEPLARLLGLVPEPTLTIMMPVSLPNVKALTNLFEGLLEAAGRPDLVDELAPLLAQRFPAALRRTLEHPEGRGVGPTAPASGAQEPAPKDRLVRQ